MRTTLKTLIFGTLAALLYGFSPLSSAATIAFHPESCTTATAPGGSGYCFFYVTASGGSVEFSLGSNSPWQVTGATNGSWSVLGGDGGAHTACTGGFSGFTLSSGQSCGFTGYFYPTAAGTVTGTFQIINWAVAPLSNTTYALSGTAVAATTSVIISGLSCPNTAVGSTSTCTATTASITTTGSSFTVNSPPVTLSTSDFSIAAGSCTGSPYASCALGTITFHPTATGTRSATVTPSTNQGTGSTATLTGVGTAGTATVGVSGVSCTASAGFSASCTGTATITASGGPVTLNATPVSVSGTNASEFSVAAGTCASASLTSGTSCNLGTLTFSPAATGTRTATLTASVASGTAGAGSALNGTGASDGTASVSSYTCPTTTVSGGSSPCASTLTVTASGGSIKLGASSVYTASGSAAFVLSAPSSNACTTGQTLSSGSSCNLTTVSSFTPSSTGSISETFTVTPALGTAGAGSLTGTGASLTASASSVSCGTSIGIGTSNTCASAITLTANGAPVTLGATPFTLTDSTDFSVTGSSCTANQVLAANGTCSFSVQFSPQSAGAKTTTVTIASNFGSPVVSASGTGVYGTASVSVSGVTCSTSVGFSGPCTGTATVSATGGAVILNSTPVSVGGTNGSEFSVAAGSCANTTLTSGSSCSLGTITFAPATTGTRNATLTASVASGTAGTAASLIGTAAADGMAVVSSYVCPTTTMSGGSSTCSTTLTVSASAGPIKLGASPVYSTSGSAAFALSTPSSGACTPGQTLSSGSSCNLVTVSSFTPSSTGAVSETFSVNPALGAAGSGSLSGTAALLSVSTSTVSCGSNVGVGTSATCASAVTVTANGAPITLAATPLTVSDATNFTITGSTCAANQVLAAAGTCSFSVQFNPQSAGAKNATLTINSNFGNPTVSVSGTGVYGTLSASPTSLACGSVAIGSSSTCASGTVTLTAAGGAVSLGASPFTLSDTSDFSVPSGTCTNTTLQPGQTCTTGAIVFKPQSAGALSSTLTVATVNGSGTSVALSGTGLYGTPTLNSTVNCPDTGAGLTSTCSGSLTLTAVGGPIVLTGTPITVSNATEFGLASNTCTANLVLANNQSCSLTFSFKPQAVGARSSTVTLAALNGSPVSTLSGTGVNGQLQANASAFTCPATNVGASTPCGSITLSATGGPVTLGSPIFAMTDSTDFALTTTCTPSQVLASGASCTVSLTLQPTVAGTLSTSITANAAAGSGLTLTAAGIGYTYSWSAGQFGACSGGSGTWQYTTWAPANGCGQFSQSRSASCVANANSGTVTRAVTCLRSDGITVSNSNCSSATEPATSQACTPMTGFSCGTEGALTQLTSDTSTCTYSWSTSAWSASSNTCSATATQTRTVSCLQSDGETVSDALCSGAGAKPAVSQTIADFSTCTFSWQQGGYPSTCTGGSGSWQYTNWVPASGCGQNLTQTRTGSCVANSGSVTQTQTVTCLRSDGTTVASDQCNSATMPSATRTCTPVSGFICGAEGTLTQMFSDTSTCTYSWNVGSWSASSNTCSANATQTRSVSCLQSDGSTVADALCAGAGSKPAATQTVSDFSTCTYGWQQGGFPTTCTGGSGSWQYTNWAPATGCGQYLTQTRAGSCVANAHSVTQTQTVTCLRSDGATVPNNACDSATMPSITQTCTPTSGFTCGTEGALSQSFSDTSTCTYSWSVGAWSASSNTCSSAATQTRSVSCLQSDGTTVADELCSGTKPATRQTVSDYSTCTYSWEQGGFGACSGGSASWQYTNWSPTTGCGTGLIQSRAGTCVANANSGTATQTVTCLRSDGTTVDNSNCSAATEPAVIESCTPTNFSCGTEGALTQTFSDTSTCTYSWNVGSWGASSNTCSANATQTRTVSCLQSDGSTVEDALCSSAGSKPATTQSVADFSTCTFSWQQGGFPATCTGGSGSWQYSSWSPTTGCGSGLTQTRTGACVADTDSVTQTQTVTCLRSDGTTVDFNECDRATMPPTTQTCTPTSGFSCAEEGPLSQSTTDTSTCTYAWNVGAWGASLNTCSASTTQSRSVACLQSDGTSVPDALCVNSGSKPATSQTVSDYSTCTYGWKASGFGTCAGGSGTWTYASWSPTSGCGTVNQTRTSVCTANPNSGTQAQLVSCLRSDGATVADGLCDASSQPARSQACTPSSVSCGAPAPLSQALTLTNACSYSWVGGNWSACTGGAGMWQYTQWTPAVGSACTNSLAQTRSGTCVATSNSGTQSRMVSCQDQNGNVVDSSLCSGTALPATQSCTPTTGFSCGTQGALSQVVSDTSTCSYSWSSGDWSACTGGNGTWSYSAWAPSCGVGSTTQTRTGSCLANTSSGSQTRVVACTRTDGTTVASSFCTGTAPASTQSCTPTVNFSCGAESPLAQKVMLTKPCVK